MRWIWIDRVLELESGRRVVAVKSVSTADPASDEYMPGFPVLPASLIIEGVAQAGGILVSEAREFQVQVVLAKVGRAVFHFPPVPGDMLRYEVTVRDVNEAGAAVEAKVRVGQRLQGEIELMFAYLDAERLPDVPRPLIPDDELYEMVRLLGAFDVAQDAEGRRREPPDWLLESERRKLGEFF